MVTISTLNPLAKAFVPVIAAGNTTKDKKSGSFGKKSSSFQKFVYVCTSCMPNEKFLSLFDWDKHCKEQTHGLIQTPEVWALVPNFNFKSTKAKRDSNGKAILNPDALSFVPGQAWTGASGQPTYKTEFYEASRPISDQMSPTDSGYFEYDGCLACPCKPNKVFQSYTALQDHCNHLKHISPALNMSLGYKPASPDMLPVPGDGMPLQHQPCSPCEQAYYTVYTEMALTTKDPTPKGPASTAPVSTAPAATGRASMACGTPLASSHRNRSKTMLNVGKLGYSINGTYYFGEFAKEMLKAELSGKNPIEALHAMDRDLTTGLLLDSMGMKADENLDEKGDNDNMGDKFDKSNDNTKKSVQSLENTYSNVSSWVDSQGSKHHKSLENSQSFELTSRAGGFSNGNVTEYLEGYYPGFSGFMPNQFYDYPVVNLPYNSNSFSQLHGSINNVAPPSYSLSPPMETPFQPQKELGIRPSYGHEHYGPKDQKLANKNLNAGNRFNRNRFNGKVNQKKPNGNFTANNKLNGNANVKNNLNGASHVKKLFAPFKNIQQPFSNYPNHFDAELHAANVDPIPFIDADGTSEVRARCFGCPKAFKTFTGLNHHLSYYHSKGYMNHGALKTGGRNVETTWDDKEHCWVLDGKKVEGWPETTNIKVASTSGDFEDFQTKLRLN